jgi:hypothetical protein
MYLVVLPAPWAAHRLANAWRDGKWPVYGVARQQVARISVGWTTLCLSTMAAPQTRQMSRAGDIHVSRLLFARMGRSKRSV